MINFLSIVFIVFGILQIILFFKMWGMTNDIKEIRNKYIRTQESEPQQSVENLTISDESPNDIFKYKYQIGDLVVNIKTDKQMRIKNRINGKYSCYSSGGSVFDGEFEESEIKIFNPLASV